jgi:TPR repeat protein
MRLLFRRLNFFLTFSSLAAVISILWILSPGLTIASPDISQLELWLEELEVLQTQNSPKQSIILDALKLYGRGNLLAAYFVEREGTAASKEKLGKKPIERGTLIASLKELAKTSAKAQNQLGLLYTNGQAGLDKNYQEAAKWFQLAADQNYGDALNNLANLYQAELLKDENSIHKSLTLYRLSAELGYPLGMYNYALCFLEGLGQAEPDMNQSFLWARKAAESGVPQAMTLLAKFFLNGQVVEQNEDAAFEWLTKAKDYGDAEAKTLLDQVN